MILVVLTLIAMAFAGGWLLGEHLGYDKGRIIGAALEYQRGWEDGYGAGDRSARLGLRLRGPRLQVHRGGA